MNSFELTVKEILLVFDCVMFSHSQLTESDLDSVIGISRDKRKDLIMRITDALMENFRNGLDFIVTLNLENEQLKIMEAYLSQGGYWFHEDLARGSIGDVKKIKHRISGILLSEKSCEFQKRNVIRN